MALPVRGEEMDEDLTQDVLSLRAVLGSDSENDDQDVSPPSNIPEETWRCSPTPRASDPPCSLQGKLLNLLKANTELQHHLQEVMGMIDDALEDNNLKQEELICSAQDHHMTRAYGSIFSPIFSYFIDHRRESPPTQPSGECDLSLASMVHWKIPIHWNSKREIRLTAGVRQISIDNDMAPVRGRLELADIDRIREEMYTVREQQPDQPLPRYLDNSSWDQLAYRQFNNTLSGTDCRLWWSNKVHPSLNNDPWNKEEDQEMIKLVKDLGEHNWGLVAEELRSHRTPLACLQRYQRTYSEGVIQSEWTEEQKLRLVEAVRKFGRNWVTVSSYVGQHNAVQCFNQYKHQGHKLGRWSREEDELLKKAVDHYGDSGTVWSQIAALVPSRSSQQCRERYRNCIKGRALLRPWTSEDSQKLLTLAMEYIDNNCLISWIEVASKLNRRDDCCRKHFLATATKEQKLQMKTLRVKQNKANSKKYARKEDKSKLTHADITDEMLGEDEREILEESIHGRRRRRKKRRIETPSNQANQSPTSNQPPPSSSQPSPLIPGQGVPAPVSSDLLNGHQYLPYVVVVDVPGQSPAMYLPIVNPYANTLPSAAPPSLQASIGSSQQVAEHSNTQPAFQPIAQPITQPFSQPITQPSVTQPIAQSYVTRQHFAQPVTHPITLAQYSSGTAGFMSSQNLPSSSQDNENDTATMDGEGDTSFEQSSATEQSIPTSQLQESPSSFSISNALARARHTLTNSSSPNRLRGETDNRQ